MILLDAADRVFLFAALDTGGHWNVPLWMTVGGGLERGETPAAAAVRELREETGIQIGSAGECVCHWDAICPWGDDVWYFHEDFFVIRNPDDREVQLIAHTEDEKQNFPLWASRWWSAAEILASGEAFAPPDLGAVLGSYLADSVPAAPIRFDGWSRTLR